MSNFADLEQYDALIFDMDGTLVDSGQLHEMAWRSTLETFDLPIDPVFMRSLAGVPTMETIQLVSDKFQLPLIASLEQMNEFKESLVSEKAKDYVKATSLISIVEYFQNKKKMAVGTGAYTEEAKEILEHCGLASYIDIVIGADKVKNPKPAPDTFLLCAELLNVPATACIVFEDSKLGLQAADRAGMAAKDVLQEYGVVNHYFLPEK